VILGSRDLSGGVEVFGRCVRRARGGPSENDEPADVANAAQGRPGRRRVVVKTWRRARSALFSRRGLSIPSCSNWMQPGGLMAGSGRPEKEVVSLQSTSSARRERQGLRESAPWADRSPVARPFLEKLYLEKLSSDATDCQGRLYGFRPERPWCSEHLDENVTARFTRARRSVADVICRTNLRTDRPERRRKDHHHQDPGGLDPSDEAGTARIAGGRLRSAMRGKLKRLVGYMARPVSGHTTTWPRPGIPRFFSGRCFGHSTPAAGQTHRRDDGT